MATAKQLAALAKGRAARKKKLASSASKKRVNKAPKKRTTSNAKPAKPRLNKYIVKITLKNGDIGYLLQDYSADTEIKNAWKTSLKSAENLATIFFNKFKHQLSRVEVVNVKK